MSNFPPRYKQMSLRLSEIRSHLLYFLPTPVASLTTYTNQQFDLTRAYVLLAHAEIETFCENVASDRLSSSKTIFDTSGKISTTLRTVITYHQVKKLSSWHSIKNPTSDIVSAAVQSLTSVIRENHGVKAANLAKLFYPLGVLETSLGATWLAQMDSFGSSRGSWAHNSVGVVTVPDPVGQLQLVGQISTGLLNLEKLVRRLR